jgi:drug/metabolite transporter (DMT)-like permease
MDSNVLEGTQPAASTHPARAATLMTDASLVLMALIWGINYSVVKFGAQLMAPLAYNGLRVVLAMVALSLLALVPQRAKVSRRDIIALILLGTIGNGLYQVFFVEGVSLTRAGDAALVVAASPALIAIIGRIRGVERVGARGVAGIALSILGIGFVVYGGASASSKGASITGDLLVLAGSVCWALYTVLLTPYTHRIEGLTLNAWTMIGGAIVLLIAGAPDFARLAWTQVPLKGWLAIGYSGLLALTLAYLFWYRGIRVLGPTRAAMYSNLQPVFALAVAWVMLGETPTIWQGVGTATIMSGLLLTRQ